MSIKQNISLVVPVYNESFIIRDFYKSLNETITTLEKYNWEIIFVDDGSLDNTWTIIQDFVTHNPNIRGVKLSRNFGKEIALTAGVESTSNSDAVIFMDGDLQHPPFIIKDILFEWEKGFQIVSTKRLSIQYSIVRKLGSRLFYYMLNKFSEIKIEPMATDFRLLDKKVVAVLLTFNERTRFFRGLVDWMGFKKTVITFSAPNIKGGSSSFSLRDLFNLAINSFTAFSLFPLRVSGWLGVLVIMITSMITIYMFTTHIVLNLTYYTPSAYFMVFNTFLFGVVLAALGLVALYIGHILTEVVRRPLYILNDKIGFKRDG